MPKTDAQKDRILEQVKTLGVKLVALQFVDILGKVKSVTVPTNFLEDALENGVGFDGSSIEGFVRIFESDMILKPDPSTFAVLPWSAPEKKEARLICDVLRPGGDPFEGDPRYVLKSALKDAEKMGFRYNTGPELEFFLFNMNGEMTVRPVPNDLGGYFDFSPLDLATKVKRESVFMLEEFGLEIEAVHHEVAPGQHEIDFKFGDALTTADNVITYKTVIKAVAADGGVHATFMPKPLSGINGSGMHTHQSLSDLSKGNNAFYDPKDEYRLSKVAYNFIGGQLKYAREICGIVAPTVNSYKRLVVGYEAPVYICWGRRNRSALIRVPEYFPGYEGAMRAELRCPDPSCNPYLAFAVMLQAGLEGIRKGVEPPDPVEEDVYEFDDKKLAKFYIESLPSSLKEAADLAERSKLVKDALGEYVFKRYLDAQRAQWEEYRVQVTSWEREKYLSL